ncbi:unnamed protein product, partial [Laminaria digitata]
ESPGRFVSWVVMLVVLVGSNQKDFSGLPSVPSCAENANSYTENPMVNHLAICSWSLQPADTAALLQSLDTLGLTRVQIALDAYASDGDEHAALTKAIEDEKISIVSGMMTTIGEDYSTLDAIKVTGGLRPDAHWEANLAHAKQCAACAKQFGIKLVTLHAGFIPEGDPRLHGVMMDRLCHVAQVFNDAGV